MKNIVIIPTYNEKENIEAMVEKVLSLPEPFDILVVDDGSPDKTAELYKAKMVQHPNRLHLLERSGKLGLGTAYIAGFKKALELGYDKIFEMDCDFSHNPDDLLKLSSALEEYDLSVGSRYIQGVNVVNWSMKRLLMSFCASMYVRYVTRMPVRDATAGFVGYRASTLRKMNLDKIKMKGYGFQIEMKYTAFRLKMSIKEVSIIFIDRTLGVSKMSGGIFGEAFFGVMKLPLRKIKANE